METRRSWFDERGLALAGDRRLPFYAGAMHYWRVDPARWAACLRAMHGLGFTLVETYVPWRIHAPALGEATWAGANDLPRFLETAATLGLSVVLRPGPHINAELTSFGIPDWVLGDPDCQARTAHDTPAWLPVPPRAFPIPSYASTRFRERVRAWYSAVADRVRDYLAPDGPVVAIGVDNEAQLFFRTGAFDLDYHPDALTWWRDWSGLDEAPRRWHPDDDARCVQWVTFKDEYIARALGDFAKMFEDHGLGEVARFHNLPPGHHQLYDLRRVQRAVGGPVGLDAYTARAEFRELRRRATALVGNATPVPIAFEVGVGFFPWFPPLDSGDKDTTRERDHLLTLLASGVRGFNIYMAVERDRWSGAAIDATGHVEATWLKPLLAALAEIDWPGLRRQTPIAVLDMRADHRFGLATSLIDPLPPVLSEVLGLGPGGALELGTDAAAITARRWHDAVCHALELAQVGYVIVDETASEDELARYRAVIAPTGVRIDRAAWTRLRGLAEHKRCVVVIGPGTPARDELDQPLPEPLPRRMGKLKAGSLEDLAGLAEDLAALAEPDPWQVERPDDVRVAAFADAARATKVVFLLNDGGKVASAVLLAPAGTALRDPFSHEVFAIADGRASVAMPPHGVRMLIVD